jgi:DNA repair protein RecO (recombination protein O)
MRLGEADRIVNLYTRDRGLVSAVAKGVRKTLSRTGGRLEPFTLVDVVLYPGRSLYTVTGVDTVRSFAGIGDSLFRIEEGGGLLLTIRRLLPEEEGNSAAFNLLVRGIAALSNSPDRAAAAKAMLSTQLKLLVALGYMPRMDACSACGSSDALVALDAGLGGFACVGCAPASSSCRVAPAAIRLLQQLLEEPLSSVGCVPASAAALAEARRVSLALVESHTPS